MKYIVTGGAGFIGSNLVDKLVDDGHEVFVFDDMSTGRYRNLNQDARMIDVDISKLQINDFSKYFNGVDVVFHLAAKARVQPSIERPVYFNETNVTGTLRLLKLSIEHGVRRFVYSSSSSVYGNTDKLPSKETDSTNPLSPYGAQKLIGEIYCKTFSNVYNLETVSLRYFNVYGERQVLEGAYRLVMGIFIQQKLDGEPMTINGDGEQRRDFTYVGDVVRANILASQSDKIGNGEVINIGNGNNRSVNDLADMIGGDRIYREPVIEPKETLAGNSLAKELLNWTPTMKIENWISKYKKEMGL
jgi:UDP-glucose 4-epimerase|tara:strand:+ start:126 stop:1031 length:906 start_codon:yes stop_codon:yes gene_type:complete